MLIYDPKVFDGRVVIDEHTRKMNRQAAENEYYHPDFHSSMNMGVHYLGETYGEDVVKAYLTEYTQHVHRSFITQAKQNGLAAIEQKIRDIYRSEKAEDVLQTKLCDHLLTVQIKHCPAVRHLTSTGRTVSPWYRYVKETVLEVLADAAGVSYEPVFYDAETGASEYRFVQ